MCNGAELFQRGELQQQCRSDSLPRALFRAVAEINNPAWSPFSTHSLGSERLYNCIATSRQNEICLQRQNSSRFESGEKLCLNRSVRVQFSLKKKVTGEIVLSLLGGFMRRKLRELRIPERWILDLRCIYTKHTEAQNFILGIFVCWQ